MDKKCDASLRNLFKLVNKLSVYENWRSFLKASARSVANRSYGVRERELCHCETDLRPLLGCPSTITGSLLPILRKAKGKDCICSGCTVTDTGVNVYCRHADKK